METYSSFFFTLKVIEPMCASFSCDSSQDLPVGQAKLQIKDFQRTQHKNIKKNVEKTFKTLTRFNCLQSLNP